MISGAVITRERIAAACFWMASIVAGVVLAAVSAPLWVMSVALAALIGGGWLSWLTAPNRLGWVMALSFLAFVVLASIQTRPATGAATPPSPPRPWLVAADGAPIPTAGDAAAQSVEYNPRRETPPSPRLPPAIVAPPAAVASEPPKTPETASGSGRQTEPVPAPVAPISGGLGLCTKILSGPRLERLEESPDPST